MDEDEDDVHYCLVCSKTVHGLSNYILHKKNECTGRKVKTRLVDAQDSGPVHGKFGTQSGPFPSNSQTETVHQSYHNENYTPFSNEEFLASTSDVRVDQSFSEGLADADEDFKKILSSTTGHLSQESGIISSQINLVTDPNHVTLESHCLPSSLSPIFSVPQTLAEPKLSADFGILDGTQVMPGARLNAEPSVTEDFGILSVDVTGNRNNKPQKSPNHLRRGGLRGTLIGDEQLDKEACDQVEDFFQSLELMSKSDPRADRTQLPISNFLSNLTFSDDEDLGFDFGDDMSLEDSEDEDWPPRGHTGGKWRPGEKTLQHKKMRYSGKWPPGEGPFRSANQANKAPASRGKNIMLIPGHKPKPRRKSRVLNSNPGNKVYTCSVCDIKFHNRFQYSNHCSSKLHKESAKKIKLGNNEEKGEEKRNDVCEKFSQERKTEVEQVREISKDVDINEYKDSENNEVQQDNTDHVIEEMEGYETDDYFDERSVELKTKEAKLPVNNATEQNTEQTMSYSAVAMPLHICTVCDKKFRNKFLLARHLLTKLHYNRSLGNKEIHEELVQRYLKYIVKLSPYQCSICQFYFNKNDDFEDHLRKEEHEKNLEDLIGEIQCTLCQFKTHSVDDIRNHVISDEHSSKIQKQNKICIIKECHTGSRCKFCGISMYSYTRLQTHILLKHADGKLVTGIQKRKTGIRNRPICPSCGLQTASPSALILHVRRKHSKEKDYKCEYCGYECVDRYSMINHLKSPLHTKRKLEAESAKLNSHTKAIPMVLQEQDIENKLKDYAQSKEISSVANGANSFLNKSSQVPVELGEKEPQESDNLEDSEWNPKETNRKKVGKNRQNTAGTTGSEIKCNHCSATVKNYEDLRPHYLKEHSAHTRICELCDQLFLSEKGLKLHILSRDHQANIESSEGIKPKAQQYFQCQICKKKFTDESYSKFHTAYQHLHTTTEEAAYKASGYKSVTREKFASFLKSIEQVGFKETLACPECGTKVKKMNVMVHLRCHTDERPFLCRLCPKTFKSNYTLRKHLLGHYGCLETKCKICGKIFNKPCVYQEHIELHALQKASKEKTQICDTCGQSFYLESQLKVHKRRHRERNLQCTYPNCHWTFAFKHELNSHMVTHTDVRPFLCTTCGYAAYSRYQLKRHERSHSNERKYHCEYCPYKAGNKTHLHRHMRIHIGSKPFKCPYCDFACNTHENIRKHILETKKHAGLKVYPCNFCEFGTNSGKEFRAHLIKEHEKESDGGARGSALSEFTGLFNRSEDLLKPEEGMKIQPCKVRKCHNAKQNKELEDVSDSEELKSKKGEKTSERRKSGKPRKQFNPSSLNMKDGSDISESKNGEILNVPTERKVSTDGFNRLPQLNETLVIVTETALNNPNMPYSGKAVVHGNTELSGMMDGGITEQMTSPVGYKFSTVGDTGQQYGYKIVPSSFPNACSIPNNSRDQDTQQYSFDSLSFANT